MDDLVLREKPKVPQLMDSTPDKKVEIPEKETPTFFSLIDDNGIFTIKCDLKRVVENHDMLYTLRGFVEDALEQARMVVMQQRMAKKQSGIIRPDNNHSQKQPFWKGVFKK